MTLGVSSVNTVPTPLWTVALAAGPDACLDNRDGTILCGPGSDLGEVSLSQRQVAVWLKDNMEGSLAPGGVETLEDCGLHLWGGHPSLR